MRKSKLEPLLFSQEKVDEFVKMLERIARAYQRKHAPFELMILSPDDIALPKKPADTELDRQIWGLLGSFYDGVAKAVKDHSTLSLSELTAIVNHIIDDYEMPEAAAKAMRDVYARPTKIIFSAIANDKEIKIG